MTKNSRVDTLHLINRKKNFLNYIEFSEKLEFDILGKKFVFQAPRAIGLVNRTVLDVCDFDEESSYLKISLFYYETYVISIEDSKLKFLRILVQYLKY
ncbi:hypothetical protein BpHYR1_013068 [Brachionus plicatilis]|uniref:Uncharacterized protein n=1 Tax=Brachionus plicatilis TaxID=10195 RepID=A0A3M7RUK8_BRAPC|nr:hypothetical protein BpHYR1_013068 [Brachionus plicatilis]